LFGIAAYALGFWLFSDGYPPNHEVGSKDEDGTLGSEEININ